jgi:hypothetical protein
VAVKLINLFMAPMLFQLSEKIRVIPVQEPALVPIPELEPEPALVPIPVLEQALVPIPVLEPEQEQELTPAQALAQVAEKIQAMVYL